jgi:hypothetical protein
VVVVHERPSAMRAHVVEVPAGRDVLSCVARGAGAVGRWFWARLGASQGVVLWKEPSPLELRGTTVILGLAGCFFLPSTSPVGVVMFLDRLRGAVLGGGLAEGGLVVAQPIVVMVATFVGSGCSFLAAWPDTGGAIACRCSSSPVPDVPTAQRKHANRPAPPLPWSRCARVVAAVSGGGCVDGVPLW